MTFSHFAWCIFLHFAKIMKKWLAAEIFRCRSTRETT